MEKAHIRRSIGRRVALLSATLLVCLLVGEWFARRQMMHTVERATASPLFAYLPRSASPITVNTPDGKRLVPGSDVIVKNHVLSGLDVRIRVNRHGFRAAEIPDDKPAGEVRVLALGDSIVFGEMLPAEQLFVSLIERGLQEGDPARSHRWINAGISDLGLAEELSILRAQGLRTKPDHVVVFFFLNDSRPPQGFVDERGAPGFLARHSVLVDTAVRTLDVLQWMNAGGRDRFRWRQVADEVAWKTDPAAFAELVESAELDWGAAWREETWPDVREHLDELRELSRDHGFAVTLVAMPVVYQVLAEFVEDAPQRRLATLAGELGFGYLDVLPALRAHREESLFYDQCHPTPRGNRLIADAVLAHWREGRASEDGAAPANDGASSASDGGP